MSTDIILCTPYTISVVFTCVSTQYLHVLSPISPSLPLSLPPSPSLPLSPSFYHPLSQTNHAMVIVHHSATAIIQYAKIARKQHLHSVCLDSLSKIHSIPSVPVLDCFQKIRQQVL